MCQIAILYPFALFSSAIISLKRFSGFSFHPILPGMLIRNPSSDIFRINALESEFLRHDPSWACMHCLSTALRALLSCSSFPYPNLIFPNLNFHYASIVQRSASIKVSAANRLLITSGKEKWLTISRKPLNFGGPGRTWTDDQGNYELCTWHILYCLKLLYIPSINPNKYNINN